MKGVYQSGQMGQTVNLLALPSVVRIHPHPQQWTTAVTLRWQIANVAQR